MTSRYKRPPDDRRQWAVEAVALFSMLIHARDNDDLQAAAQAQRHLNQLGVLVRFRTNRGRKGGGDV